MHESVRAITVDVLRPTAAAEPVTRAYADAEVLLEMSASVAVARHLGLDAASPARRVSLFLNPAGTDLVLLAEPADRSVRLDQLEMDYDRALLQYDDLSAHLLTAGQPVRYSYACRDVSGQLSQEQVALHAAIGARAVRTSVAQPTARLALWQAQPDLSVTSRELPVSRHAELRVGSWTVSVSHAVLREMSQLRQERLPNETGGILLGVFDTQRERVYVVDFISSPSDSQGWPTAYYRGVTGVPERLSQVSDRTGRQVAYAGEWHSHPNGCPTLPSTDDQLVFAWLRQHRRFDGLPALMAIAGEHDTTSWYVGDLAAGGGTYSLPSS